MEYHQLLDQVDLAEDVSVRSRIAPSQALAFGDLRLDARASLSWRQFTVPTEEGRSDFVRGTGLLEV